MFVFIVPFKSNSVAADWQISSRLCENAIASMLADPSPQIRVVLACSEIPERLPADSRLLVRQISVPTPVTLDEKMADKYLKNKAALVAAREFAPAWLMLADADDLVSHNLVSFISGQKPGEFWYSEYGWRYSLGSRFVTKLSNFHRFCGTSGVNYVTKDDLPTSPDDPVGPYVIATPHPDVAEKRKEMGFTVRAIPFPTTIYINNSGENWSGAWSPKQHDRRTRLKLALNTRPITHRLRQEFGLNHAFDRDEKTARLVAEGQYDAIGWRPGRD